MKSKKSFCNKTIFLKDIIRLWPLWVIGIIITLFSFAVPFFTNSVELFRYGVSDFAMNRVELLDEIRTSMVDDIIATGYYLMLMAVMAIVCAVLVFQYLNRQCSSYMLHSLPISRKTMYVTHYLSGFFMYILPYLLLWCVLGCLNVLFGIQMGAAILGYVLETLIIALFFYSLACFIVMLSSSSIMSLFVYAVINVMVYVFFNMVETVIDLFAYGTGNYYAGGFDWKGLVSIFTPGEYLLNALGEQDAAFNENEELFLYAVDGLPVGDFHYGTVLLCLLYLIPAIVFFVAACMLYQRRKLERVDENLVFPWSKVIYRVVFCCCGSYIFTWLMYYLTYAIFSHLVTYQYSFLIGVFYLLIGAILCYLICDMILAKSFFIWKRLSYLQMGVITVGIILVFLVGHHAYLRHSTANDSQIETVKVSFNNITFHITEEERMDSLLVLQKEVMAQGSQKLMYEADNPGVNNSIHEAEGAPCNMTLTYTLKNQGEIYRSYRITTKEDKLLTDIILYLNDTKYLMDTVLPKDFKERIKGANFNYYVEETNDLYGSQYDDIEIIKDEEMYNAFIEDLQEGHIVFGNIYNKNRRGLVDCGKRIGTLSFDYVAVLSGDSPANQYRKYISYADEEIECVITEECTHVLKVLVQELQEQ